MQAIWSVCDLARYYRRSPELISYQEVTGWLYHLIKDGLAEYLIKSGCDSRVALLLTGISSRRQAHPRWSAIRAIEPQKRNPANHDRRSGPMSIQEDRLVPQNRLSAIMMSGASFAIMFRKVWARYTGVLEDQLLCDGG